MQRARQTRRAPDQHDGGFTVQATFAAPLGGSANQFTVGVAELRSRAQFAQSSQFGFLTPDRGIVTVDGDGAFADGTQESENAFDARVDLTGDTRTRSIYLSDTVQLAAIVQLTLVRPLRSHHHRERGRHHARGEPGSLDGESSLQPLQSGGGCDGEPERGALRRTSATTKAAARHRPSSWVAPIRRIRAACRMRWPAIRRWIKWSPARSSWACAGASRTRLAWNAGVFRADNRDDIMFVADDTGGLRLLPELRQDAPAGRGARRAGAGFGALDVGANYTFLDATYRSEEEVLGEGNSTNEEGAGLRGHHRRRVGRPHSAHAAPHLQGVRGVADPAAALRQRGSHQRRGLHRARQREQRARARWRVLSRARAAPVATPS